VQTHWTEAIRRALAERRQRLASRVNPADRRTHALRFLEDEVWPWIPADQLGRRLTRDEEDEIRRDELSPLRGGEVHRVSFVVNAPGVDQVNASSVRTRHDFNAHLVSLPPTSSLIASSGSVGPTM